MFGWREMLLCCSGWSKACYSSNFRPKTISRPLEAHSSRQTSQRILVHYKEAWESSSMWKGLWESGLRSSPSILKGTQEGRASSSSKVSRRLPNQIVLNLDASNLPSFIGISKVNKEPRESLLLPGCRHTNLVQCWQQWHCPAFGDSESRFGFN